MIKQNYKQFNFMSEDFDIYFNNLITNLKIIQQIDKYDKLSIDNDICYIDKNTYYQGVIRWWYSNNRQKSYLYIENNINKLIDIYNDLQIELKSNSKLIERERINNYIIIIRNNIDISIKGFKNIQKTYNDDDDLIISINTLIDRIKSITYLDKIL